MNKILKYSLIFTLILEIIYILLYWSFSNRIKIPYMIYDGLIFLIISFLITFLIISLIFKIKKKKKLKEFFKSTKGKIILTIVMLFITLLFERGYELGSCDWRLMITYVTVRGWPLPLYFSNCNAGIGVFSRLMSLVLDLIFFYIISSIIIYLYNQFKSRKVLKNDGKIKIIE